MGYVEVDPNKALVWSAIVHGVISVPIMAAMVLVGQSEKPMAQYTISASHRFFWVGVRPW
jgi:Mn2+/Fe2+ NRAMP family transporter